MNRLIWLALLVVPSIFGGTARAQYTWTATANDNWSTATAWAGGTAPVSGTTTTLTFGGTADFTATNDLGAFTLNKLIVSNTGATSIDGGAAGLTFAGTSPSITINAGSGITTIAGPITYSAATAIANNGSALLTLSGLQTLGGNLTFTGTGAYSLTGGATLTAARTLTNNGTGLLTVGAVNMGAFVLTVTGTGNTTISGIISGTIAAGTNTLTKSGTGNLRLSGANTFTGNITLSAGTLTIGGATTLGAAGNTISIANGTTIVSTANLTTTTAATNGHIFSWAANAVSTWDTGTFTVSVLGNQLIGATGTLNKIGTGIISIGSSGTATIGTINVNAGRVRVTSQRTGSVQNLNVNNLGQFEINDDGVAATFSIAAGRPTTLNGNGPTGSATPGAFIFTDQTPAGAASASPVSTWANPVTLASDSTVGVYAGTTAGRVNTLIFSQIVSGPGNLTKAGPGILVLSAAGNSFGGAAGTTTVLNGGLQISGGADRLPVTTSLVLGSGTANTSGVFDLNGQNQTVAGLTTAGTGTANKVLGTSAVATPTFTVNYSGAGQTYAGNLGGSIDLFGLTVPGDNLAFTKAGSGILTLSGTNTYTGTTAVSAGTLVIGNQLSLSPNTPSVALVSGAVLDTTAVAGGLNFAPTQTLTAGRTSAAANDIVGGINVAGTLNVGGTNTAASLTITGNAAFGDSTLRFDLNNTVATGNDTVAIGGNLSFTGTNALTINKLNGPLANGDYTLFNYIGTLTGDATNFTVTGAAGGRQTAVISTATANKVVLSVSGSAANLTWVGNVSGNVWDQATTANFTGAANNDNRFYDGDTVTFNATGVGGTTPVLVAGPLSPSVLTVAGAQDYAFNDGGSGSITGTGNFVMNGSGTVTLGVPVTLTGTTTINTGTLTFATGGSITGAVTVAGGTLNGDLPAVLTGPLTVTGGTVNAQVDGAFTGSVSIAGGTFLALNPFGTAINNPSITVSGSGTLQIGNGGTAGDLFGTVTLATGGTLAFNRSDAGGYTSNLSISGTGTLRNDGTAAVNFGSNLASAGNLTFGGSGNFNLNGSVTGTTAITKTGTGTLSLLGLNSTLTGPINILGGTLQVSTAATAGGASVVVTLNGGTYYAAASQTNNQVFNIGANGGTLKVDPGVDYVKSTTGFTGTGSTLTITGGGSVGLQGSGNSTISNVIVQSGIYNHTSVRYVAANTTAYTITVLAGGTLMDYDTTSFSNTAFFPFGATTGAFTNSITLNGDGYIGVNPTGAVAMFGAFLHALGEAGSAAHTVAAPITLGSTSRFTLAQGINGTRAATDTLTDTFTGGISGPGGLILDGDGKGTLAISGLAATYLGDTRVAAGILRIGLNNALPITTLLILGGTTGDNAPDSSGTFELNGKSQIVAGLGTLGFGSANRIGNAPTADGTLTVNYNGATPQTFSGQIGYTDASNNHFQNLTFTKDGTGTLILSGTNAYTRNTTVLAGTLGIAVPEALSTGSLQVTVASGAVLDVSAIAGGYTFDIGRTLIAGRTGTPANDILGSLTIGGTVNVGGSGSAATLGISGDLTLNQAALNYDLSNTLASGNDRINVGGNLTLTGTSTFNLSAPAGLAPGNYTLMTYAGTLNGSVANLAFAGIASNSTRQSFLLDTTTTAGAVLLKVAGSPATLTWAGNVANNVWDLVGTANFTGAVDSRFYNADIVTFNETGIGGTTEVTLTGALSPAALTVTGTQDYTFSGSGNITGATGLTKSGIAQLTLVTDNTYTGLTTVAAGTLQLGNGGTTGSIAGPVSLGGGTLQFNRSDAVTFANAITLTADSTIGNAGAGTVTVSQSFNSAFNLTLATNSTAGSLTLGGATTLNGTSITVTGTGSAATAAITIGTGNGTITSNTTGQTSINGAVAVGANTLTFAGTGNTILNSSTAGTGNIIKNGTGTVTFTGTSTFTGTLTINAGTVAVVGTVARPAEGDFNAASIVVNSGGLFNFGDGNVASENPDLPANTMITLNAGGTAQFNVGEDYGGFNLKGGTYASKVNSNLGSTSVLETGTITSLPTTTGSFAGAGLVRKTTPGTVTVTGVAFNGTGGLNIEEGTFSTDSDIGGASGNVALGTASTAGTLKYTGTGTTLAKAVALNAGGGTLEVFQSGAAYTVSGPISGTGPLTKTGAGTLSLTAVNTNTGAITVAAGALTGTGTVAAPITVQSAARIGGGSVASPTGTLTTANVTVVAGGVVTANLAASGTNSKLALGTNTLDLATGSSLSLVGVTGFDPLSVGSYTLATTTGGNLKLDSGAAPVADGFIYGQLVVGSPQTSPVFIDTTNFGSTFTPGDQFVLSRSGDNLLLSFTPAVVPEPALLLGLGALGLGGVRWWRRRRPVQVG